MSTTRADALARAHAALTAAAILDNFRLKAVKLDEAHAWMLLADRLGNDALTYLTTSVTGGIIAAPALRPVARVK